MMELFLFIGTLLDGLANQITELLIFFLTLFRFGLGNTKSDYFNHDFLKLWSVLLVIAIVFIAIILLGAWIFQPSMYEVKTVVEAHNNHFVTEITRKEEKIYRLKQSLEKLLVKKNIIENHAVFHDELVEVTNTCDKLTKDIEVIKKEILALKEESSFYKEVVEKIEKKEFSLFKNKYIGGRIAIDEKTVKKLQADINAGKIAYIDSKETITDKSDKLQKNSEYGKLAFTNHQSLYPVKETIQQKTTDQIITDLRLVIEKQNKELYEYQARVDELAKANFDFVRKNQELDKRRKL